MKRIFFLFLAVTSLSSCSRYYYTPNQHNIPMFKEKKEARLSGAASMGAYAGAYEVQAAYAPTKGLGLMANAYILNPDINEAKAHFVEFGAGYYKPIPSKFPAISEKFVVELYGVSGWGKARNYYCNEGFGETNFFKGYLQPSIGFTHDIADVGLSARIGLVNFYNTRASFNDTCELNQSGESIDWYTSDDVVRDLQLLTNYNRSFLFEPAITARVGYQYAKFQFQVGWSFLDGRLQDLNDNINLNFGVVFSLAPRFWKKHRENKLLK
jgi:hypothetical protein